MNKTSAINLQNITKAYKLYKKPLDRLKESLSLRAKCYHKEFKALENISFSITKGEVVGIIGTNGSGKSTLLKIITSVIQQTSGSININGNITAILELGAGFNPELTGYENIKLHATLHGISSIVFEKKIDEILQFAEIGEFIHQPIKVYSSGMKARLGFSFLIHIDPEIFIVDEALSVGDVAFQRKCFAKIEDICKNNQTTVLFVSHSEQTILQLCNRVILLNKGKLIYDGEPKEAFKKYKVISTKQESNSNIVKKEDINTEQYSSDYFSKKLKIVPSYTISTKLAKIINITLLNENKEKVNILQKNKKYTFEYDVFYSDNFHNVVVAMKIKTLTGLKITGCVQELKYVEKNKKYHVVFEFINLFNHGHYFFNCGTNKQENGNFEMLCQLVDCYMFESKIDTKNRDAREIIDLISNKSIFIEGREEDIIT